MTTVFLAFAIKDVMQGPKDSDHSLVKIIKTVSSELSSHPDYVVAILASMAGKFQSISCNRYGTLLITAAYEA